MGLIDRLTSNFASFDGKGLFGYTFGPLKQKDIEIYYIEVITRVYYVLCGSGYFTINDRRYDVSRGMLVELLSTEQMADLGRFLATRRHGVRAQALSV
jgi:hypothetical protein